ELLRGFAATSMLGSGVIFTVVAQFRSLGQSVRKELGTVCPTLGGVAPGRAAEGAIDMSSEQAGGAAQRVSRTPPVRAMAKEMPD
ncbi:MAG: hypothetical protein ACREFQ_06485, partial [Stellaceae bacterium]